MPRITEASFDDINDRGNSDSWKILSPNEAEQLRKALEHRAARAAQNQQPQPDRPQQPEQPRTASEPEP
jgi:hypothetical protein